VLLCDFRSVGLLLVEGFLPVARMAVATLNNGEWPLVEDLNGLAVALRDCYIITTFSWSNVIVASVSMPMDEP
jgi:hypothetical protein